MATLRTSRCDDCPYKARYVDATAFTRARGHAERRGHRVTVLAGENSGEKDTVYDCRPKESGTGSVG